MKKHLFALVILLLVCSSCATDVPKEITKDYFMSNLANPVSITKAEIVNNTTVTLYATSPDEVYSIAIAKNDDLSSIIEYLKINHIPFTQKSKVKTTKHSSLPLASLMLVFVTPFLYFMYALILFFVLKNIVRKEFQPETDKIVWVIIVLFAPFIGFLLYYFYGRKTNK
ncbi:PLD nuclease N-terminal domain-containing protein [Cellulophaga sp. F20128]|uniref:PLD nuclease N-terminal domain-containing protein n=1 Tax=Cellulophaga sp. F20128 TaxID=2926413 RepID=UPI001FF46B33|nr:PLD nuclease N-terminal domain-containing protein [Cellulophaga sp. F20128]MCK0155973.1 PLD nuclease N-terminal domain-containing protein [Cellulophaga sp. F20128]